MAVSNRNSGLFQALLLFLSIVVLLCGVKVVNGDAYNYPVNFCTNTITANLSHFMRAQDDWEVFKQAPLPPHYTGPVMKNATYIPETKAARHLLEGSRSFLQGGALSKVDIAADSPQGVGQKTNLEYLLMLDPDRLAYNFRVQAGLHAPGSPYGGWEAPDKELRGHFVGHYLSATAFAWEYSKNDKIHKNMNRVVDALAECQEKIGSGYLSAFPEELFDRFEKLQPVWAPYYTIHKIMAGLLDQFVHAGNTKAFRVLLWMVQYFSQRINNYIKRYSIESHYQALNEEFGGMNEVLYNLYRITGDPEHLKLAHLFDKPCFLGLLAMESDSISGFHANTHLPIIVGAEARYEYVGDEKYKDLSEYFMHMVNSSHLFVTGGTSTQEFWTDPNRLATALSHQTEETCATYNMLKISRNLFRWTQKMEYADYYERAMVNGILSVQRGQEPGVMIYMLPLLAGSSKAETDQGWGTPFGVFWCCYGTGIESFAKLGDSIYFEDNPAKDPEPGSPDPIPGLYVIQFVSSTYSWNAAGLKVKQTVEPLTSYDPELRITFEFLKDDNEKPKDIQSTLNFRVPSWTTNDCRAKLNDHPQDIAPGSFLSIQRIWQAGDKLSFVFPASIRTEHIKDDRDQYAAMNAIFFGPYVLAGMSRGDSQMTPPAQQASPATWILPVDPSNIEILYSFKFGPLGKSAMLGHDGNGSIIVNSTSISGTDFDYFSTFRVIPAITDCSESENGCFNKTEKVRHRRSAGTLSENLVGKLVSFELMDKPKTFVAHDGIENNLVTKSLDDFSNDDSSQKIGSAVFKVVPALSHAENSVSFEAAGIPGCYVHADGLEEDVKLKCVPASNDKTENVKFNNSVSFVVNKGLASYHPQSFIAESENRSYLLFPINAYKDEHYTVYFDMA